MTPDSRMCITRHILVQFTWEDFLLESKEGRLKVFRPSVLLYVLTP